MTRILTALVLVPTVMWLVLFSPQWAFQLGAAAVGLLAFREFDTIAAAQGIPKSGLIGMLAGLALLLAPEPTAPVVIVIAVVLMAAAMRAPDLRQSLPGAAVGLLGVVYIFGAWRCAGLLRGISVHWLMISFIVSWAGDTAAMYVGKSIGRHKLAPRVSPNKTVEGALGSVVFGIAVGVIYAHYFIPDTPIWLVLFVCTLANVAGQLGDLCESAFKRGADVKDSGTSLPGHGGWLDRIDSSLFSVPVVYATLLWLPR
ncbi:MAG: phosphatidate cytidylyltransferase [Acidobacteriota bacterium]